MLIDANTDPNTVAANVWTALRDRLLTTDTSNEKLHAYECSLQPQRSFRSRIRAKPHRSSVIGEAETRTAGCLSRRPHSACLADWRRARDRQGDAGLSHGAICAWRTADPAQPQVQSAETLELDPMHPVARHVAADTHGGLLTLERTAQRQGRDAHRHQCGTRPARRSASSARPQRSDGWRVCIVDTVDELNPNAANALLKVLEEPPRQSLFLLVSHAPARVLPTIQSRCRKLALRPLATDDVIQAAAQAAQDRARAICRCGKPPMRRRAAYRGR